MSTRQLEPIMRWGKKSKAKGVEEALTVSEGLAKLYKARLFDLEKEFKYSSYYSPLCTDGDFSSKPMVMLIGQYSTGKTTFISHLLETEYPGTSIGPEPTTDRFVAVMHGDREQRIPGNAAVVDPSRPFERLSDFGNSFLSRFEIAVSPSPLLNGFTVIDTPGVLSGNKQTSRGYDFEGVIKWLADRVDLILLMFDAHKLDISDEFKRCIEAIRGNDTKVRILLNKADLVNPQQLMRVYGALMWSLGKVIPTPEVNRVFIGSFWDKPLDPKGAGMRELFEQEAADLYADIQRLPRNAAIRKLNDFVKRARLLRAHLRLCEYLRSEMPFMGKSSKQKKLMAEMPEVFRKLSVEYDIPLGDFPAPEFFNRKTEEHQIEFHKFPKLDPKKYEALEEVISRHVPQLLALVPEEERKIMEAEAMGPRVGGHNAAAAGGAAGGNISHMSDPPALDAVNAGVMSGVSPFMQFKGSTGFSADPEMIRLLTTKPDMAPAHALWQQLKMQDSELLSGAAAKDELVKSRLPSSVLHRIWALADAPSKDGMLSQHEFALCMHFIKIKHANRELPQELPAELYPDGTAPPGTPSGAELATILAKTAGRK